MFQKPDIWVGGVACTFMARFAILRNIKQTLIFALSHLSNKMGSDILDNGGCAGYVDRSVECMCLDFPNLLWLWRAECYGV